MFSAAATGNYTLDFSGDIDDMKISVGTRTLTLLQDLTINNTLTINSVASIVGVGLKFLVSGDVTSNDTSYSASAIVSLVGSADQSLLGTGILVNLDIAKLSGNVLMSSFNKNFSTVTVSAGQWDVLGNTVTATFTAGGGEITGAGTLNGNVTVGSGGTLGGTVIVNGAVVANSGGTVNAGSSPGQTTINGNLTLNASSTLFVDINGDFPQHDQLLVTGGITINGATLDGATGGVPTAPLQSSTTTAPMG